MDPFADQAESTENASRLLGLYQELGLSVINAFFQKFDYRWVTWYHPTGEAAVRDFIVANISRGIFCMDMEPQVRPLLTQTAY